MIKSVSLKFTLIIQFVLCALVPLLLLSAFFISSFRTLQIDQQVEQQRAVADRVMSTAQFALEKAYISLEQLARDKNVALAGQSLLFGYSAANALSDFEFQNPFVASAMLLDARGGVVEASPTEALTLPSEWLAEMSAKDKPQRLSVIEASIKYHPELARELFEITRNVPLSSEISGHLLVLSIPLYLSETERLDSRSTYTGALVAVILIEDVARLIYQRSGELSLASISSDNVTLTFDPAEEDVDILNAQASISLFENQVELKANFYLREDVALAPIDVLTARFSLYAGIIVIAFLLVGYMFVRLELKPLDGLNQIVRKFHQGDFSNTEANLPFIEFRNVAQLLNEMGKDIREHQEGLEAKVANRTEALEQALTEVKKINRELIRTQNQLVESEKMSQIGVLVAGVAHEVNTPIGVCVTATSILENSLTTLKDAYANNKLSRSVMSDFIDNATSCMEILSKNTERAAELIQSFKAVSVDQSSEQKRAINVHEYINLVLRSLQKELDRHSITVELEGPPDCYIETYPGAFSQILGNLILNTIKHAYSDEHEGERVVSIEFHLTGNSELDLTYKDNGQGVPPESLPKLFDPFYTTSRQSGGSGLGLSIVYNLATQRLNGKINCYCEPDDGLTVFIEFPVTQTSQLESA
ncbi:HAMP domain-containing sensor histidine kinase [Alteromonas sp. ASW11-36]|uniref:histidine kinase n=1 Tax=Alteromonas arenosi TaxID=3055817 RepID=A0ABT7T2S0_9ALTE|nr:HAMP domain-containing sensor histidine kinase [Alteromonas sp. ASW11-36]MDM7862097.1 HAMP domain-containing sensor histidine kinase [Alteromonas sp. ASW11-36]